MGPLARNEWYQIILTFSKLGETQYEGPRIKEAEWQVFEFFYGQADQPERAYSWNVTVIQVNTDPGGNETSIAKSPKRNLDLSLAIDPFQMAQDEMFTGASIKVRQQKTFW